MSIQNSEEIHEAQRADALHSKARALGLVIIIAAFASDFLSKSWMLHVYDITAKSPVPVTPFFDLVMVWNYGISYGLFQQNSPMGQWFLAGFKMFIVIALCVWLWRNQSRLIAFGLGLIVGGALGNVLDRLLYGAVADFFHFHLGTFSWYVFNLADIWIVAGVAILLYESFIHGHVSDKKKVETS
jgi:signal peptidase II